MSGGSNTKAVPEVPHVAEAPAEQVGELDVSKGRRIPAETRICSVFAQFVVRQEMRFIHLGEESEPSASRIEQAPGFKTGGGTDSEPRNYLFFARLKQWCKADNSRMTILIAHELINADGSAPMTVKLEVSGIIYDVVPLRMENIREYVHEIDW